MGYEPTRARWEHTALEQRADELINVAAKDETPPGRFHWRRVPGTLSLAVANVMSAGVLLDTRIFNTADIHVYSRALAPAWVWGTIFLAAGLFLTAAVMTRRWFLLNIGSALSLFVWTAISVAAMLAWLFGRVEVSPIASALLLWMTAGQAAMLITPLVAPATESA